MGHRRRSRHHKGHAFAAWPRALVQKGQAGVVPHQMNCHHRPPQHDTPAGGNPPWCSASCMWPCCGLTGGSGSMAWCGVVEGICKPRRPSRRRGEGSGAMRWAKDERTLPAVQVTSRIWRARGRRNANRSQRCPSKLRDKCILARRNTPFGDEQWFTPQTVLV